MIAVLQKFVKVMITNEREITDWRFILQKFAQGRWLNVFH